MSQLLEPMAFDEPAPIEVPVTIGERKYVLREALGDAAAKYRSAAAGCGRDIKDGRINRMEGIGDVEPYLVSLCLFELHDIQANGQPAETKARPVTLAQVKLFPERIVRALFDRAKTISSLDEPIPPDKDVRAAELMEQAKN